MRDRDSSRDASAMTMLPPEILSFIFSFLDEATLKDVRQCTKVFAVEGARCLYQTLILYCASDSIGRLNAIAQHESFRHLVRAIHYVPNTYQPYLSFPQWQHWCNRDSPNRVSALIGYRKHFEFYQITSRDQQRVLTYRLDAEAWRIAHESFPNLIEVQLLMFESSREDQGLLHNMTKRSFMAPDCEFNQRPDLVNTGIPDQKPRVEMFGFEQVSNICQPILRSVKVELANAIAGCQLEAPQKYASLKYLRLVGVTPLWLHCLNSSECSAIASQLTHLWIDFFCTKHEVELPGLPEQLPSLYRQLKLLLNAAPKLSNLYLSMSHTPVPESLSLDDIVDVDTSWPLLQDVILIHVIPTLAEIDNFWSRHCNSLSRFSVEVIAHLVQEAQLKASNALYRSLAAKQPPSYTYDWQALRNDTSSRLMFTSYRLASQGTQSL